jgi:hypothetical protein
LRAINPPVGVADAHAQPGRDLHRELDRGPRREDGGAAAIGAGAAGAARRQRNQREQQGEQGDGRRRAFTEPATSPGARDARDACSGRRDSVRAAATRSPSSARRAAGISPASASAAATTCGGDDGPVTTTAGTSIDRSSRQVTGQLASPA